MMQTRRWLNHVLMLLVLLGLSACGSTSVRPKPTPLAPNPALLGMKQAWSVQVGKVDFALHPQVDAQYVTVAGGQGAVVRLNAKTGAEQWRATLNTPLSAGVGSDGRFAAVVSRGNALIVLDKGREIWRSSIGAQVFTAPLVAGLRVFVLDADRNLTAFDAESGRRLWQTKRRGDALVLRQAGILTAVGNTLIMGVSGHLLGLNPLNGSVMWDVTLASPRSTNDIERLVDVVDGVARSGKTLCARAFQSAVACLDAESGTLRWSKPANGFTGLSGDEQQIFGVEEDGQVQAWLTADGSPAWHSDVLRYHQLSGPLLIGRSVAVGDESGLLHLLSRVDGSVINRVTTDGSAIGLAPILAANTLVVVTSNGGVFGFQPD